MADNPFAKYAQKPAAPSVSAENPLAKYAQQPTAPTPQVSGADGSEIPQWGRDNPRLYGVAGAVRQTVGPVAEMLGMIGGGALGAAAGAVASPTVVVNPVTAGAAGSALGYGIAKSALDVADELLGDKAAPKTAGEALARGGENLATGAAYELGGRALGKGIELVGRGVSTGIGKATGALSSTDRAARIAQAAAGDKTAQIQNALRQAPEGVTASQAIANQIDPITGKAVVYAPETQALLRTVEHTRPTAFGDIYRGQDAATRNVLADIAKGSTQAEARGAQQAAKKALNELTTPMREAELAAANTAGRMVPQLEGQIAQKQGSMVSALQGQGRAATDAAQAAAKQVDATPSWVTHGERAGESTDVAKIMSMIKGQRQVERDFAKYQLESLEAHGLRPLESAPVVKQIENILSNPAYAGNDAVAASVKNVSEEMANWTNKNGVITAEALDAIRKNAVDAAIRKLNPGMDQVAQKNLAGKVLADIKPVIDDAIEAAGGTGWRNYLDTYSKGMNEISKTKLGAEAMRLYQTSPQKFLELVEGNSPEVIEKIFGAGRYSLAKEMGDEIASRLQAVGRQVRRAEDISAQASEGKKQFDSLLKQHMLSFQLPNMLNTTTHIFNRVANFLTGSVGKKTMDKLTTAAKDAKSFDDLLKTLPTSERSKVLKSIKEFAARAGNVTSKTAAPASVGLDEPVNNLAQSANGKNALAER